MTHFAGASQEGEVALFPSTAHESRSPSLDSPTPSPLLSPSPARSPSSPPETAGAAAILVALSQIEPVDQPSMRLDREALLGSIGG
jgi:hypothetical protein